MAPACNHVPGLSEHHACYITQRSKAVGFGVLFIILCLLALPANLFAQNRVEMPVPFMPATPKKVLADIDAPADVQAVVSGGWGYTKTDSMIMGNPYHDKDQFFDVQAFESELIELRNMEEFYTVPGDYERHFPIGYLITKQTVHTESSGRRFDQVEVDVDLLPEEYWPELDSLMESGANFDQIKAYCRDKLKTVQRVYWFDITRPYQDNVKFYSKPGN